MCLIGLQLDGAGGLLVVANREEFEDRPFSPPTLRPPRTGEPRVVAPTDDQEGGTWLALNEHGLVAAVLNRRTDPPHRDPHRRTRGELPLLAAASASLAEAELRLRRIPADTYNPFVLVVADGSGVRVTQDDGPGVVHAWSSGTQVLASRGVGPQELAWTKELRLARALRRLPPDARTDSLLAAAADRRDGDDPRAAVCLSLPTLGFATVSTSVLRLTADPRCWRWDFTHGPPDRAPAKAVDLAGLGGPARGR